MQFFPKVGDLYFQSRIEVFADNKTLTMLTYMSILCFNLGDLIRFVWNTQVSQYVILSQYTRKFLSSNFVNDKVIEISYDRYVNFVLLVIHENVESYIWKSLFSKKALITSVRVIKDEKLKEINVSRQIILWSVLLAMFLSIFMK